MTVAVAALVAAVLFAAFHVPLPQRRRGAWGFARVEGRPAMVFGIAYHLMLLPAVAALPAPLWATAAGIAWMLLDVVLDGAELSGTTVDVRPFRDGVHILAAVWLIAAGWTGGVVLGLVGTALAAAFLARLAVKAARGVAPAWFLALNAVLNLFWMVCIAIVLWR